LYGTTGEPSFAIPGARHLVQAGAPSAHQRELGGHEERIGQYQDHDRHET
jgi:hypothetical protein